MVATPEVGKQCEICGHSNPDVIETHHQIPQRMGGTDTPDNLISLCGSCHNAIENLYDDDFFERVAAEEWPDHLDDRTDYSGRQLPSRWSPDRQFPKYPVHVTIHRFDSKWPGAENVERLVEDFHLFQYDDLEEFGYIERMSVEEWKNSYRISAYQDKGFVPDQTEEWLEKHEDSTKFEILREIAIIHCGYCNEVFFEHETSRAVAHLQIKHRVENPYLRESDNLSNWEKRKRVLSLKDSWNRSDSELLSFGSTNVLKGGYDDQASREDGRHLRSKMMTDRNRTVIGGKDKSEKSDKEHNLEF